MKNSFKVLTIGGIAVYVNRSWLLAIAFITWTLGTFYHHQFPAWSSSTDYVVGFISGVLLFVTVLIHELAHSFTARANGLPVNTITLFIFGGVSSLTKEPPTPKIELLVALAGPLASLAIAGLFFLLHALAQGTPSEVTAVLGYLASVNVILAIFNLIPGFPLDGGRVLRAVLWMALHSQRRATRIASTIGQGIGYLFIIGGLVEALLLGDVLAGIWAAFIGWFLQNSASAASQQAVMDGVLIGVDVRDVMDTAQNSVGPGLPIEELVFTHLLSSNQRAIPVNGPDGQLAGLVTLNDVKAVARDKWPRTPVSGVMTPLARLRTVAPDDHLRAAMQALAEHNYHQLPVLENGRLVGMLNRAHVLQYLHVRERLANDEISPAGREAPTSRR